MAWLELLLDPPYRGAALLGAWIAHSRAQSDGSAQHLRYSEAVGATERIYQELLEYQWRLDALETHLRIIAQAQARPSPREDEALERCPSDKSLLERCLADTDAQRSSAVAALEERARHYAVTPRCPQSGSPRADSPTASGEAKRKEALEQYRRLADEVYGDIASQARAMLEAEQSAGGLHRVRLSLERSRVFWLEQMEETWTAWQKATEHMHLLGSELSEKPRGDVAAQITSLVLTCGYGRKQGAHPKAC